MTSTLLILAGLVLLVLGGELLVRGAVKIATALGVSRLLVGLVLVGFGTSTPELVTSLHAALSGSPGIAIGNVVGSNICNILLILGMTACIAPFAAKPDAYARDLAVMLLTAVASVGVLFMGEIGRLTGLAFLVLLAAYVTLAYLTERDVATTVRTTPFQFSLERPRAATAKFSGLGLPLFGALGGMALTILGAKFLVDGAVDLARLFGLSETVIGLTIVAVGTSLPELVSSVVAARKGAPEVAIGNVLGSNIYNLIGILGVTAVVAPIPVPPEILRVDVWAMLGASVAMVAMMALHGRFTRVHGQALIGAYAAYVVLLLALPG